MLYAVVLADLALVQGNATPFWKDREDEGKYKTSISVAQLPETTVDSLAIVATG